MATDTVYNGSINKATAAADTCFTCEPLEQYIKLTTDFTDKLSTVLQEPMTMIYASTGALWIVVVGLMYGLSLTSIEKINKDFISILAAGIILHTCTPQLITTTYKLVLLIMGGLAQTAFETLGPTLNTSGYSGITALAANAQNSLGKVFDLGQAMILNAGMIDIRNIFYGLLIIAPFFIILVLYSAQIAVAIFRALLVCIFGPFLFLTMSYSWGLPMLMNAARTLLSATVVLFGSTACMVLAIFSVNAVNVDTGLKGEALSKFASISNPDFFVLLFVGITFAALLFEGVSIANSIAQSSLTNTAAGMMAAGGVASAATLAKMSNPLSAGRRYSNMAKGMTENAEGYGQMYQHGKKTVGGVMNKFKSLNKKSAIPMESP